MSSGAANLGSSFNDMLAAEGQSPLVRGSVTTLQVNVGKLCNMACTHCHVEAGPARAEIMAPDTARQVLELIGHSEQIEVLDLTGGAPELNPSFKDMVHGARALGCEVIDRCNLTVLLEPGHETLPAYLAEHHVRLVASMPCYLEENVNKQRGPDAYTRSVEALRRLNQLGYGQPGSGLEINLVYNPGGAFLPPDQAGLEAQYKAQLDERFGITFNQLLTITNMPIHRFEGMLRRSGEYQSYMQTLVERCNPMTLPDLMCRSMASVSWDGVLYDCDFNQMIALPIVDDGGAPRTLANTPSLDALEGSLIATDRHCYGCTAGAGSSCAGALR